MGRPTRTVPFSRAAYFLAAINVAIAACSAAHDSPTAPGPVTAAPVLTTLQVSVTPGTIAIGQTALATATGLDQRGMPIATGPIVWSTSAASVATVDANGVVSGAAPGQAQVIAQAGGTQGQQTITVTGIPVASVSVRPTTLSMPVGRTGVLVATLRDANGNSLAGRPVTWVSSDSTRVRVSTNGLVTALSAGTATITASREGQRAAASVYVSGSQSPTIPTVIVQPVFFFPTDAPINSYFRYDPSYAMDLERILATVQNRYAVLLSGMAFDSTARNSFFTAPPAIYRSSHDHAYFTQGDSRTPDRFHRMIAELLDWQGADRYSSNAAFVMIYMRPNDTGYFTPGGRTFNGRPGTGGGGCYFDIYDFKSNPLFLSTLTHELGHAFGLPHVDVYGFDMNTSTSIMSYNPANHSIDRFTYGPAMGGNLIAEDYYRLGLNKPALPNFSYDPAVHNPTSRPVNTTVFLGPMNDPLLRP